MALRDEGTVKIKKNGLTLDSPQRWHFPTLKTDIVFDVDGTAEVPGRIAEKLLGAKFDGMYSLVEVVKVSESPVKEEAKPVGIVKPRAKTMEPARRIEVGEKPAPPVQADATTEFVKEII